MLNLWHTIFHVRTKMTIDFHICIILLLKWSFNYVTGISKKEREREIIRCFFSSSWSWNIIAFSYMWEKRGFSQLGVFFPWFRRSAKGKIAGESHHFSTILMIYSSGWEIIQKYKIGGVHKNEGNLLDRSRISCRNCFVFSRFREIS